jgi:hypothetical protein
VLGVGLRDHRVRVGRGRADVAEETVAEHVYLLVRRTWSCGDVQAHLNQDLRPGS